MPKYSFTVNGESHGSATAAFKKVKKMKSEGKKISTLRVNGEPLSLSALEHEVYQESLEKAHKKLQGL